MNTALCGSTVDCQGKKPVGQVWETINVWQYVKQQLESFWSLRGFQTCYYIVQSSFERHYMCEYISYMFYSSEWICPNLFNWICTFFWRSNWTVITFVTLDFLFVPLSGWTTMEFACGFIFVPPSLTQRDGQRSGAHLIKRSGGTLLILNLNGQIAFSRNPSKRHKSVTFSCVCQPLVFYILCVGDVKRSCGK